MNVVALLLAPAWGTVLDSLVRPRVGSRCGRETRTLWRPWWDQQDLGPLGAVNLRRSSQLPTTPLSRACRLLLLFLRTATVMAAPLRVVVAIREEGISLPNTRPGAPWASAEECSSVDGHPLFFIWRILSLPLSSALALVGASVLQPTLGTPVT